MFSFLPGGFGYARRLRPAVAGLRRPSCSERARERLPRKKSSLSHSGSICPEFPHSPLIPQGLPRRNLDEGGSGTAGVKLSKNLPPIRLSESRRAELCQKFRHSVKKK